MNVCLCERCHHMKTFLIGIAFAAVIYLLVSYWFIFLPIIILLSLYIWHKKKKEARATSSTEEQLSVSSSRPQDICLSESLPRLWDIYYESFDLVTTSQNLKTVSGRYGDMLKFGKQILAIVQDCSDTEEVLNFKTHFQKIQDERVSIFNAAIDRAWAKQKAGMDKLKTEKAKQNRIKKFKELLVSLPLLPEQSLSYGLSKVPNSSATNNSMIPAENLFLTNALSAIPQEIIQLLWFANGPLANYTAQTTKKVAEFHGVIIETTLKPEPSLIDIHLEVGTLSKRVPPLSYYPSYEALSPDQRAVYLNWLKNIDEEIDIGYVFIFYYGLERYLLTNPEKYLEAFYTILRLRKHHTNTSFQGYSYDALLSACIYWGMPDEFQNLIQESRKLTPLALAFMVKFSMNLYAEDIMINCKIKCDN